MGRHTPSRMPMLARSTSSRWLPKTMTSARGATGVWLCMPPPGRRSPSTSPRRSRSQVRPSPSINTLHSGSWVWRPPAQGGGGGVAQPFTMYLHTPVALLLGWTGPGGADSERPALASPSLGCSKSPGFIIVRWSAAPHHLQLYLPSTPSTLRAQWLGAMPIRNKSHQVNKPLFLGKSWDRVQMHVISPWLPRRMGACPAPVPLTGTSCGVAGKHWGTLIARHSGTLWVYC